MPSAIKITGAKILFIIFMRHILRHAAFTTTPCFFADSPAKLLSQKSFFAARRAMRCRFSYVFGLLQHTGRMGTYYNGIV